MFKSSPQRPSPPKITNSIKSFFFPEPETTPSGTGNNQTSSIAAADPIATTGSKNAAISEAFAAPPPPPMKKGNPRDNFQRANSHPIRLEATPSRPFDPSMAAPSAMTPSRLAISPMQPQPSMRSTIYGACSQVLCAVASVTFQTIKTHGTYLSNAVNAPDNNTMRRAKLLYISLLEKAQKERGEWQSFAPDARKATPSALDGDDAPVPAEQTALELLTSSIGDMSMEEAFSLLNELVDVSFRNMRCAIVSPAVYGKHKKALLLESLACPPSLTTLLLLREMLNEFNRDEKHCLLRLLSLWYAIAVVGPELQDLRSLLEDKHTQVFSESSEMEFMQRAARQGARSDPVAMELLLLFVHYRDVLFSDLEFVTIRQEMHIAPYQAPNPVDSLTLNDADTTTANSVDDGEGDDDDDDNGQQPHETDDLVQDGDDEDEEVNAHIPMAVPVVEADVDSSETGHRSTQKAIAVASATTARAPAIAKESVAENARSPQKHSQQQAEQTAHHAIGPSPTSPVVTVRLQRASPKKTRGTHAIKQSHLEAELKFWAATQQQLYQQQLEALALAQHRRKACDSSVVVSPTLRQRKAKSSTVAVTAAPSSRHRATAKMGGTVASPTVASPSSVVSPKKRPHSRAVVVKQQPKEQQRDRDRVDKTRDLAAHFPWSWSIAAATACTVATLLVLALRRPRA